MHRFQQLIIEMSHHLYDPKCLRKVTEWTCIWSLFLSMMRSPSTMMPQRRICSTMSSQPSPLPSPHFYRSMPNYLHSFTPDAQTISICHASPPRPHSKYPKDCTTPCFAFSHSKTLPTSISRIIRSTISRLCRFSAIIAHVSVPHVNTLWKLCIKISSP